MAESLALAMLEEFGTIKGEMQLPKRAPVEDVELWKKVGILPRSIDRRDSGGDAPGTYGCRS